MEKMKYDYLRILPNGRTKCEPTESRTLSRKAIHEIIEKDLDIEITLDKIIDHFKVIYEAKYYGIPRSERFNVFKKYKGHCMWCQKRLRFAEMTLEHIKPLVEGGDYSEDNLGLSCERCNMYRKNAAISNDPSNAGYFQAEFASK